MKAYSLELRQKIIETYKNKEGSIRQVAQRFKVARSFVQKLLKQEKERGSVAPLPHGGGSTSKLESQVNLIEKLLDEKNDATLAELCENLKERTGRQISISSMCRFCQKHQLTRKKTFHAAELEKKEIQEQRRDYWQIIREVDEENLVFLDETGVNLALCRTYARSKKGTRALGSRPYQEREQYYFNRRNGSPRFSRRSDC